jgi:hypothetical protein
MSSSRSPDRGLHALAGVALILVTVLAAGMTWPPTHALTYWILTDETGPVELSTFACFIIAAVVSARLAAETRRRGGGRSSSVVYGLFALFMFLAAMEEISWGQSLLDFRTPAWLNEINAQGETNLHNLDPLTNLSSLAVLVLAVTGLARATIRSRKGRRNLDVPIALAPLLGLIAAMAAIETLNDFVSLGYRVPGIIGALSEAAELLLATACMLVPWIDRRRLRREWAERQAAPASRLDHLARRTAA